MIRPGVYHFVVYQGATFDPIITYKNKATGTPIDLTGFGGAMQARFPLSDDQPQLSFSTAADTLIFGGTAGTIKPILTPIQAGVLTVAVGMSQYKEDDDEMFGFLQDAYVRKRKLWILGDYDLELYQGDWTGRLLQGYFLLSQEVTR